MKAKLICDENVRNPAFSTKDRDDAIRRGHRYSVPRTLPVPAGTVIEHHESWLLVKLGLATPEDDECRDACAMTDEEIVDAHEKYLARVTGLGMGLAEEETEDDE